MMTLQKNNKGSALLTVLVVMVVLIAIGMSVIANASNNLKITDVVTLNERSYYASEDAAQVAMSTIKNEVSKYYMTMQNASSYSAYQALYDNFFTYLSGRLTGENSILSAPDFIQNELDGKTTVVCTMDAPSTQISGRMGTTFTVTCTTTIEGISRKVVGSLLVEAAPLKYQWTTAPPLTGDILILDGNTEIAYESVENKLTVSGSAKMSGTVTDSLAFTASKISQNDLSVPEILIWQLFYDQFDTSIANPPMPPTLTPASASNHYYFSESTELTKKVTGKNIYCNGDLTITDAEINNCNIYVTGNFVLTNTDNPDRLKGTNIYAGGNISISASNFWPDGPHPMYYYAGGNISIVLGMGGHGSSNKFGRIDRSHFTALGNITITSAYLGEQSDVISDSSFYAGGNIQISGQAYLDDPLIDQITHSTFETRTGSISIVSSFMQSSNKISSGNDVTIATYGMTGCEVYAEDNITFDCSRLYSSSDTDYYSSSCIVAAANDLGIIKSSFSSSYFYSGENLTLDMSSGYSLRSSILYSEDDVYYLNSWSGPMNTTQSSLIYSNGAFNYGAKGTASSSVPAGLQVMAKGNAYSVESDDSSDAKDMLSIGYGSYMDISIIHGMIGSPNSTTGVLAQALDNAGFEHTLPEPIVTLPYYTEVFISENYN